MIALPSPANMGHDKRLLRAFIPDAPVSNRQGYHPELLIHACIGKERATSTANLAQVLI